MKPPAPVRTRYEAIFDEHLERALDWKMPLLMGVLNLTPDSFFDGGLYTNPEAAKNRIEQLLADGADLIDIGAESSRPGSTPVPAEEQLRRLEGVIEYAHPRTIVSVDTTDPKVAEVALGRGALVINDVSCLRNPELAAVVAHYDAWLLITHSRGSMSEMPGFSEWPDDDYPDIVGDVRRELEQARERAVKLGVKPSQILFDPGLGFSKNAVQSYTILKELEQFTQSEVPVVLGASRKSFLAALEYDPSPPAERLGGSIAAAVLAAAKGARVLRVHDLLETYQAILVFSGTLAPELADRIPEYDPEKHGPKPDDDPEEEVTRITFKKKA